MNRVRKELNSDYAYRRGLFGEGIGVAVLDSGIAWDHPDLRGRVVHVRSFGKVGKESDTCGHGTHISGIIGGSGAMSGGVYQGLAPKCHFLALKVLDEQGNGRSGDVVEAISWLCENGGAYGIRIVNISLGGVMDQKEAEALLRSVEQLWNKGYLVCAAAGNEGPDRQSITVPGTSRKVITVGACDDEKPVLVAGKNRIHYSGRGPTSACVCKPDVVAPGYRIRSCNAKWKHREKSYYCVKSGTSMATPVVCGALALLLSGKKAWSNKEVKLQISKSCVDLGLPKNQQGWGRIWIPGLLRDRNEY